MNTRHGVAGYRYFRSRSGHGLFKRNQSAALRLSNKRLSPSASDPDYLLLRNRANRFKQLLDTLQSTHIRVLDVGGRIQPYRDLLRGRCDDYVAVDPQIEGLADAVAVAENLPFADQCFDLVICTQVMSYVDNPFRAVSEMHRVLKDGGVLFLSAPAHCPQYHDERWRFLRDGLELLLASFDEVDISPEVSSFGGWIRSGNKVLSRKSSSFSKSRVGKLLFRLRNRLGERLDNRIFTSEFMTSNYVAVATKRRYKITTDAS